MRIACLGWGSLIWNPGDLAIQRTEHPEDAWHTDGPELPIEFTRQSSRGRITLVIVPNRSVVRTLWTLFTSDDIASARESLRAREQILETRSAEWIDHWEPGFTTVGDATKEQIADWAREKHLDAVVWTNLLPKYGNQNGRIPTETEVIEFLRARRNDERSAAEEYVRRTPKQIRTVYRQAIERELAWTPTSRV